MGNGTTFVVPALLVLAGCASITQPQRADVITAPTPQRFTVCYGYSCREIATLALDPAQEKLLRGYFVPPAPDAATERARLARAIAAMEHWVGARTGTDRDLGGTFPGLGRPGQMDCIDESTNTTTYLKLFATLGGLRYHTVEPRQSRGFLPLSWPHTSAVIRDLTTGQRYAVDSWFLDNGMPPYIVPLEKMAAGLATGGRIASGFRVKTFLPKNSTRTQKSESS